MAIVTVVVAALPPPWLTSGRTQPPSTPLPSPTAVFAKPIVGIDGSSVEHRPHGVWRIAAMDSDVKMMVQMFM
jgi:hypothetical protein